PRYRNECSRGVVHARQLLSQIGQEDYVAPRYTPERGDSRPQSFRYGAGPDDNQRQLGDSTANMTKNGEQSGDVLMRLETADIEQVGRSQLVSLTHVLNKRFVAWSGERRWNGERRHCDAVGRQPQEQNQLFPRELRHRE